MNKMTDIDKLRESEQRYRLLFENMLNGFAYCKMLFDAKNNPVDFIYIEVNRKFEELTGLKDVVGKSVTKVIPGIKESNPEVFKAYGRVAMGGKPEKFELNLKPLAKLLSVSVYSSEKGYFTAVFENITERKNTENKLRESEEKFKLLIENASDLTTVLDVEGKIRYESPSVKRILGYEQEELKGETAFEFIHPDDVPEVIEKFKNAVKTPGVPGEVVEFRFRHKNGSWVNLESQGNYTPDIPEINGMVVNSRDITERKNLEALLNKEEQEQQIILDSIPAWVFYKDNKNRFIRVNKAFSDAMGTSKKELEGKSLFDLYPKKQAENFLKDDLEVIKSGKPKVSIVEQVESPKGIRWVQTDKIPYRDNKGNAIGIIGFSVDITERKKAEESLTLQAKALQASADAIVITDTKGIIQQINNAFTALTGYATKEAIGHNMNIIKSGKQDASYYKNFWKDILAGKIIRKEIINRRKDGSLYDEEETVTPVKDVNGQITHFISIKRDITERKKSENELKESEHRLSLNVQNMPVGLIEWDKDFQVTNFNPAAEKIFGYTKEEAMGKHANFIIPKDVRPHVGEIWKQLLSGAITQSTNENITSDGRTIMCDWHNAPLTTTDGKVFGVVSMMLDITEQNKTENELKQSQQMLQNIIDLVPVRIFWKDINLNYLGSNKAFAKDAGWKLPSDLTGKDDFQMVWKEHADLYREDDTKVIKSGISKLDYEEPLTTPAGEESWINTNKVPLKDEKGKITGVLGTYIDITDRKNIEKKLEEREEMLDEAQKVAGLGVYKTDFIKNRWESSEILDGIFGIDKDYARSVDGWASLIHPDDREMMTDYLQNEVFAKKHDFEKEYRIVQKNSGETRWVSGLGKMTFDKQNKPLTMVGTIQDITERKTADNILKQNEERYRTLINVAPLCIKWFDSEGNLVSVNRHGKEEHFLVGKSEEEIKNWKYMECIEEKYRNLVKESMQKALVSGKSSEFDMEHVPGTSTGHWCHSYLVPALDDKGKVKYVLFISRDFTAEKIAEDEKNKNLDMLEKFKELTVGRELRMIELKKQIEELIEKKDSTE